MTGEQVSYDGKVVSLQDAQLLPTPGADAPPADLDRRQRAPSARCRSSPATPTCGTPSARPTACAEAVGADRRAGRRGRAATRPTILRAGSLSLDDLDTARKHAAKWRDAGFGYLVCGWPGAGRAQVEAFAREVMPDFT